jgi:NTP pyrophosphatase (non-canonical NTP hydrolase)
MNLNEISDQLGKVSDIYAEKFGIRRDENLRHEIADVVAMTLLFAKHRGIDVEQAIKDKWFQHL